MTSGEIRFMSLIVIIIVVTPKSWKGECDHRILKNRSSTKLFYKYPKTMMEIKINRDITWVSCTP